MVSCEMTERPSAGCGAEDSGDLLPAELGVPQEAAEPLTAQSPMPWASLGLDDYQDAPEPGTESWQVPGEPSAELPLELWDDTEQFPDEDPRCGVGVVQRVRVETCFDEERSDASAHFRSPPLCSQCSLRGGLCVDEPPSQLGSRGPDGTRAPVWPSIHVRTPIEVPWRP